MPSSPSDSIYSEFFFARQPVFDRNGAVWGYELLYRKTADCQTAIIDDHDLATASVATGGLLCEETDYTPNRRVLINYSEKMLLNGIPKGLPPAVTVVEVVETVSASEPVINAVIDLKQHGYLIAIDDFRGESDLAQLMDYADLVKIDTLGLSIDEIAELAARAPDNVLKLAEKVEDPALIPALEAMGFDLFQGYYFARPQNIAGRKLSASAVSKLKILELLEQSDATPQAYAELIGRDPSIAFRLLRLLNSAAFCFSVKIKSIQHAISLLGLQRLRYWLRMVVLADVSAGPKSRELYRMSIVRGRFFEQLAATDIQDADLEPDSLFLFGLLSMLDVMLETRMEELIPVLPLPQPLVEGLSSNHSRYARYLQLAIAIETADSGAINRCTDLLGLDQHRVAACWAEAMLWSNDIESQSDSD